MKCGKCGAENPGDTRFCGQCGNPLFDRQNGTHSDDIYEAPTRTLITPTSQIRIGANFADRYHVLEELGRGGMGKVYKALDTQVDEKLALKLLNPEVAADERSRQRFRNELKTTRQISHRHICRVYDFSEWEGQAFITMEYVSGEDLKSLIRRVGNLTPGKAVFIARQIAEGLSEAHRLGVIHRDLKPHNIMIDKDGNVRIMDFGIARTFRKSGVTDTGVIIGTPEYMSPEQVEGKEIDHRTDIYSLGIILYEMLTGRVPFDGDTPLSVAVKQKTERPVNPRRLNPQIPAEISLVILRCLEKDRQLRFQDADQLLSKLKALEESLPKTDRVLPERGTRSTREITVKLNLSKMLVPALVLAALAVVTFVGWRLLAKRDVVLFAADKPSLAVMHFENNTGDPNLSHWRKALSDLLIADLSQSRFLQVLSGERLYDILDEMDLVQAPSYSSDALKNVAERGGVRYVIVGKMTRAGNTIRLNTTLQEAATGHVLGSAQVEGESEESLFALVDELTTRIKEDFRLSAEKIAADVDAKVEEITTTSAEAHRYYNEGMTYHNRGDYTKSIPLMELAVAIDPDFAMAYRAMSVAYSNLGYKSEADRRLQRAFELKDRVSERERYYIEADYFRRSEETYDKAIEAYTKLLAVYPDDHVGNNNLGVVYNALEEYDKAIERFAVNVRNQVKNYHSYSNLSNAYMAIGQLDKASKVAEQYLIQVVDHPQLHINLAAVHMLKRKYDAAEMEIEKALTLDPNSLDGIMAKGNVRFLKGEDEQALAEYQKLMDIDQPVAHFAAKRLLADFYIGRGQFTAAENELHQALELADMLGERSWESDLYAGLGYLFALQSQSAQALKTCDQAVQIAEESGILAKQRAALFNRAWVQIMLDDLAGARQSAQKLEQLISGGLNHKAKRYMHLVNGRLLSKAGKYADAMEELKLARELMRINDPALSVAADAMAETAEAAGELDKARRIYASIAELPRARLNNGFVFSRSLYRTARILQQLGEEKESELLYRRFLNLWKSADRDIPMRMDAERQLQNLARETR
jgi:serine/threonine protein kinase/Tfp pilus assembly protein PilF